MCVACDRAGAACVLIFRCLHDGARFAIAQTMTDSRARSNLVSITVHAALIAFLLTISNEAAKPTRQTQLTVVPLTAPVLRTSPKAIGGGSGARSPLPATAGKLPKIAPRQFVPPTIQAVNFTPKLAIEPAIEGPPDLKIDSTLAGIGDPLSAFDNGSAGMGGPLGIGNGRGTGVGNKSGAAAGEGDRSTGKALRAGNGVSGPVLIHRVEPEFSDEARRAKFSGTVLIHADIDQSGHPRNLRLARSLGLGLDEKALEAVSQWLFKPGMRDGKAVTVSAMIEVKFALL
jgi:periplasmic protein TonB